MRPPLITNKLILDISRINRESSSLNEFLAKSSDKIKEYSPNLNIASKELYSKSVDLSQLEEFTLNTGKPYVDNRLSGYSAFHELINYYNNGFRSCVVLPVKEENKTLGILTILSKEEDAFDSEGVEALVFITNQMSKEASLKIEKEKSTTVAKYFDASFNSTVPQLLIDRNGELVKFNKAILNSLDKGTKDFTGKSIAEIFQLQSESLDKFRSGTPTEIKSRSKDAKYFKVTSGQVNERLFHLVLYDITETRQMQERSNFLDRSEDEVFIMMDNEMKVLWISANGKNTMNIDKDAVIGEKFSDFVYSNDEFIASLKSFTTNTFTSNIKLNLGNGITVPVKIKAYRNQNGTSLILTKDYNTYIASLKNSIDELITLSSDAVLILDESGYIKSQNKSAEKLLKYNDAIAGVPISSLCADSESQSAISNALSIAKKNGIANDVYAKFQENGARDNIPFNQNIKSLKDENNNMLGFIIFGQELRTKYMLEEFRTGIESMTKQATKLKTESDLKTQFIYNISHELKTPITNISGFSTLLLQGEFGELTNEQKEYLHIIIDELKRLKGLIEQILDVVKLASGRMKLDLQPVNFTDLLANPSIKSLEEACQAKNLTFECNVEFNAPIVTADPNRLIQVLVNLIGNAIKFTDQGGITVKVSRKGKNALVEVIDTGMGINKEDRSKLFKEFYQVPTRKELTKPEGTGTGLGLSITREIVKKHGGRIDFISEGHGKGSNFWFTIPISPKKKKVPEAAKVEPIKTDQEKPTNSVA